MKEFLETLELRQQAYDGKLGRKYNRDAYSHKVRKWSRYLTYLFYRVGLRGPHILFAHFQMDMCALYWVFWGQPLRALAYWFVGHVLDNCDGDLARARGESDPKWGEMDVHLHLVANMVFWVIIGIQVDMGSHVMMLLAARVVCESHRSEKKYSERWGERSRLWYWLVLPTNVNIMYMSYAVFALLGGLPTYIALYQMYYVAIAIGQSVKKVWKNKN